MFGELSCLSILFIIYWPEQSLLNERMNKSMDELTIYLIEKFVRILLNFPFKVWP
jgi:hypothetical protein